MVAICTADELAVSRLDPRVPNGGRPPDPGPGRAQVPIKCSNHEGVHYAVEKSGSNSVPYFQISGTVGSSPVIGGPQLAWTSVRGI